VFPPPTKRRLLDGLTAHGTEALIVPLWDAARRRFNRRMPDAPSRVSLAVIPLELLVLVGDEHRDPARPNSIAVEIRTFQCAAKGAGAKASPHQMAAGAGGRGSRGRKSGRAQTARILRLDVAIRSMEAEAIFRELRNEIWLRSIKRTP